MAAEVLLPPTFALAGCVLGASFGIAYGMMHRSLSKGLVLGALGLVLGGVTAWNVHQAGWQGNAEAGLTWYGARGTGVVLVSVGIALFLLVVAAGVILETYRVTFRKPTPYEEPTASEPRGRKGRGRK